VCCLAPPVWSLLPALVPGWVLPAALACVRALPSPSSPCASILWRARCVWCCASSVFASFFFRGGVSGIECLCACVSRPSLPGLLPCLPCRALPCSLRWLFACLSGRFLQLLCRGGFAVAFQGVALFGRSPFPSCLFSLLVVVSIGCLACSFSATHESWLPVLRLCCPRVPVFSGVAPRRPPLSRPSLRPIGQPVRCCAACPPPSLTLLRCILPVSW